MHSKSAKLANSRLQGQSLVEYGLIGGAVLVVAAGGLMMLSKTVHFGFNSMLTEKSAPAPAVVAAASAPTSAQTNASAAKATATGTPAAVTPPAILKSPVSANAFMRPVDTQKAIMVTGANGATTQLARMMAAKIQKLLDTGDIDQTQANLLLALADEGHNVAAAEKVFEDAIAVGQTEVTFNGKTYETWQLGSDLGLNASGSWNLSSQNAQPLLAVFLKAFQAAEKGGALSNPAVKQEISELACQIAAMADGLGWNYDVFKSSGKPMSATAAFNAGIARNFISNLGGSPVNLNSGPVSAVTDDNSEEICSTGGGEDLGTNCTP